METRIKSGIGLAQSLIGTGWTCWNMNLLVIKIFGTISNEINYKTSVPSYSTLSKYCECQEK